MIDKLKEIKKYCDAASPAPWGRGRVLETRETKKWSKEEIAQANEFERGLVFSEFYAHDEGRSREFVASCNDSMFRNFNAEFISRSRQDLPKLVSALGCAVEALKWYEAGMPFDDSLGNEKQKAQEALKQIESILGGE